MEAFPGGICSCRLATVDPSLVSFVPTIAHAVGIPEKRPGDPDLLHRLAEMSVGKVGPSSRRTPLSSLSDAARQIAPDLLRECCR